MDYLTVKANNKVLNFEEALAREVKLKSRPIFFWFALCGPCNLKCAHCAFHIHGRTSDQQVSEEVYSHDFVSMAQYRAVPYGIYDVRKNKGYVFVGMSGDTPEFIADAIVRWWKIEGSLSYSGMNQLLILADSGGSNGCRVRGWKKQIQEKVSDKLGLTVTVCHYPPGCSKYNPVERRLFSFISINWAGKPLRSLELMLGYIHGTSTKTGLTVEAFLQDGIYTRRQKMAKAEMDRLNLQPHPACPKWNYTISPRTSIN